MESKTRLAVDHINPERRRWSAKDLCAVVVGPAEWACYWVHQGDVIKLRTAARRKTDTWRQPFANLYIRARLGFIVLTRSWVHCSRPCPQEIFFRCALGDDIDARAVATLSDPSLRLDPGELCGDLRRLELQVFYVRWVWETATQGEQEYRRPVSAGGRYQ